jgi:hypothetical protein
MTTTIPFGRTADGDTVALTVPARPIPDRQQRGGGKSTLAALLTSRDRAILRAVAAGRAELVAGAEPDLLLDGRWCCDQPAAHRLAHAGLIAPAVAAQTGQRVGAVLTAAGTAAARTETWA